MSETRWLGRGAWWAGLLLVVASPGLWAAAPEGYYATVDDGDPVSLRQTLHAVIDDHLRVPLSSDGSWAMLEAADEDPDDPGRILDVYKNESYEKVGGGSGPYEREHTWPSSYGFPPDAGGSAAYPSSDGHSLFLSDGSYNASRGNTLYRTCDEDCDERQTVPNGGRGGGEGEYPGNSNWRRGVGPTGTWETWIGRRGDVARAVMYLDVRYDGSDHAGGTAEPDLILTDDTSSIRSDSGATQDPGFMGVLSDLVTWHRDDPVDELERRRNEVIFASQGNRNPFIDHPEWVACLYEAACGAIESGEFPDFRFRVEITPEGGPTMPGQGEAACLPETVCVSGALPGRTEILLRIIGPRPNGFLHVNLVRFTVSRVEVWIEQVSSGVERHYVLEAVPRAGTELSGLVDREAFLP